MNKDSMYFFETVRDYLTVYLPKQKGTSNHTVRSYKTAMNQFLDYASDILNKPLSSFCFSDTSIELVEGFLAKMEDDAGWSAKTRNLKLSAIRSFYQYASNHDISLISYYQELMTIPEKKTNNNCDIEFFSESALKTILAQPDLNKDKEFRNLMIMILLYDTGARIQEILDLKLQDIRIYGNKANITLTGKGKKKRIVPIMDKTLGHLKNYIQKFHPDYDCKQYVFYTIHNGLPTQMSQDNVQKFIDRYVKAAKMVNPEVPDHIYCHMFRHSRAMHLYRNGMPLPLVSEWLGHAQINTTRMFYANADTEMKRNAINAATSNYNPLVGNEYDFDFKNDEILLKKLYGLV